MVSLPFKDRGQAGELLADELATRAIGAEAVVVALTRGGVPVAAAVAQRLRLELDIIVVRKLGVPWQPELALGAVAGGELILDNETIQALEVPDEEIERIAATERAKMQAREQLFRKGLPAIDLRGRPLILIDDGVATGSTMLAALRSVRRQKPSKVIVAIPVASREARRQLSDEADDLVCLAAPEPFIAVGEWYRDFSQVEDEEVCSLIGRRPDSNPGG